MIFVLFMIKYMMKRIIFILIICTSLGYAGKRLYDYYYPYEDFFNQEKEYFFEDNETGAYRHDGRLDMELRPSGFSFFVPQSGDLSEELVIEMQIDNDRYIKTLERWYNQGRSPKDVVIVSPIISATITANNFEILEITPEKQPLVTDSFTAWKWILSPKMPGKHHVHLSVNATITINNEIVEHNVETYDRNVTIKSSIFSTIKQYSHSLWTTIFVPLIGIIWAAFKPRVEEHINDVVEEVLPEEATKPIESHRKKIKDKVNSSLTRTKNSLRKFLFFKS